TLVEIATSQKFKLIEALAEKMTDEILNRFDIEAIRLTIKKLKPPINNPITYFAVEIYREKE
ncbi:dihydroneopterin aldolase, partial [Candidatus Poribacteria bacterium]|nr:dihydroneopterin aldolase [Candidatus Poribacteria bacterium]